MTNEDARMRVSEIITAVTEILETGTRAVVATVTEAGASNLVVGAKLIVGDSGQTIGSLGDEELNRAVTDQAIGFLQTRDEAKIFKVRDFAPALAAFAEAKLLFERIEAEPRLVIAGAGHVGASLARLAALVGYHVTLVDDRVEFVDPKMFDAHASGIQHVGGVRSATVPIDLVAAKDWQEAVREAIGNGHSVSVAIVTRGHKQDEECLRAALAARPDYIGMIGSKRRTNIVLEKLREEGADESELKKVRAPIGLDIGAVSPEEVALAILAEIVAERRGGSGGPLSSWRRT